jgi:ribosomal protein S18 acetylase RimI-like enzyme
MKLKIRRSNINDIDKMYELHTKCFEQSDHWYHSSFKNHVDNGIIVETLQCENNHTIIPSKIIGLLLQGSMVPCNPSFNIGEDGNTEYKEDKFEPINDDGIYHLNNQTHLQEVYGIVMICIHPEYRGKGLAQKLISKHFVDNPNKNLYLNTRRSNIGAYQVYKKMGYEHIAYIKHKYFQPTEDSIFMVKYN